MSSSMSLRLPPVQPGEPIRVSASSYVAYLACPESAMARFRGQFGPDTVPSFRGGLAHRLFARHLSEGPITTESFAQTCREEIGGSVLNHKMASLKLKPSDLEPIIAETRALYERFVSFPSDGFVGAEILVEHDAGDDVELIGSVDARFDDDNGVRLVDWKTGELGDPMHQLRFYAMLWAMERGSLPTAVEAVSVKTGERMTERPSIADAEATAATVAELVDAVRSGWSEGTGLARSGGPACRYCPLLDDCDEGRTAAEMLSLS